MLREIAEIVYYGLVLALLYIIISDSRKKG